MSSESKSRGGRRTGVPKGRRARRRPDPQPRATTAAGKTAGKTPGRPRRPRDARTATPPRPPRPVRGARPDARVAPADPRTARGKGRGPAGTAPPTGTRGRDASRDERAAARAARATVLDISPGSAAAQALPRVVLAGRPNAGKSSLFNRLLRRKKAVVDPTPGVTRDINEAVAVFDDRAVLLVDTGGFEGDGQNAHSAGIGGARLDRAVHDVSLAAVEGAALVVYVLDGKAGLSPADEAAAAELRRRRARVLFVVNKLDSPGRLAGGTEFYRLGAEELIPVSAAHGHGISDLVEHILAATPPATLAATNDAAAGAADHPVRVAIIGRPNAGKSSLLNRLLGYERAIVDPTAGTTRDALDTLIEVGGTRYVLVDTAGIRRRSKVQDPLERSSVGSAIEAIGRADVVVLVIDAVEGLTSQEQKLAALAWNEGKGLVLVVNKWDLRSEEKAKTYLENVAHQMPSLEGFPMLTTSAKTGAGVNDILPTVKRVAAAHGVELQTARLNQVITEAFQAQEPPPVQGRRPRIYYATQVGRRPPTIVVFSSIPASIHPSYHRYLANKIASAFRLKGTPLRVSFRARH